MERRKSAGWFEERNASGGCGELVVVSFVFAFFVVVVRVKFWSILNSFEFSLFVYLDYILGSSFGLLVGQKEGES